MFVGTWQWHPRKFKAVWWIARFPYTSYNDGSECVCLHYTRVCIRIIKRENGCWFHGTQVHRYTGTCKLVKVKKGIGIKSSKYLLLLWKFYTLGLGHQQLNCLVHTQHLNTDDPELGVQVHHGVSSNTYIYNASCLTLIQIKCSYLL